MFDKPTTSPTLGLEIDSKVLKGAHLGFLQGNPALLRLFQIRVNPEQNTSLNVKLLYKKGEENLLRKSVKQSLVVTALPTSEVLVRTLKIQLTKDRDIDSVLEFQAEPLLPYTIDEGIVDRITLEKGKESTGLTIVAARTDHLSQHLEQWISLDIEPEVVSCVPAALASFSGLFSPSTGIHFQLHIGLAETTCILANKGKLLAAQTARLGLDILIEAYAKDTNSTSEEIEDSFYQLDFSSVNETSTPELCKKINQLRLEVTKLLYALAKHTYGQEVSELLVTGEGSTLPHFTETLCDSLQKTLFTPKEQLGFGDIEQIKKYAVSIGMALTALPKSKGQVNFRQKNFIYPYPWKRIQKPMTAYIGLCALLAFSLYLFTPAYIANKEAQMKKDYVDLLAAIKKPFQDFEYDFRSKKGEEEPFLTEEEINVINFSQQDIEKRLNYLEKEIRSTPNLYALYPRTPRVSDVLAWLSTHPHIVGENKEKTIQKPRIQLKSFSYKMVKRPEPNKEREKYLVKVEIEFTTPTPRYAREFHDILLAPNDIIDPREEVKWNVEKNSYRASFFLLDKTSYSTSRRR